MQTLETDVVIVGGGAGGTYAALCLKEAGLKPLIMAVAPISRANETARPVNETTSILENLFTD